MEDKTKNVLLVANALTNAEIQEVKASIKQMEDDDIIVKLNLLYVKPYFPTCYFHIPSMIELAEDFEDEAKEALATIGKEFNLSTDQQWIATGRAKSETLKLAGTLGSDYILTSSSIHQELSHSLKFKGYRYTLPIRTVESLMTNAG